jgi:hypothetical protein
MKPRNLVIYGSEEFLKTLEVEYKMIGFYVKRTSESLTVFSTRPKKKQDKRKKRSNFSNRDSKQKSKSRN